MAEGAMWRLLAVILMFTYATSHAADGEFGRRAGDERGVSNGGNDTHPFDRGSLRIACNLIDPMQLLSTH